MSARLAMKVWESGLRPHLKSVAGVLALFANDQGERIYPSVSRLAWLLGKTPRRVSADLTALIDLGVLIPVTPRTGGVGKRGGKSTHYEMDVTALPTRDSWRHEPGHPRQGSETSNPDTHVTLVHAQPGHGRPNTLTPVTATLTPMTEYPDAHVSQSLRDPSVESSKRKTPPASDVQTLEEHRQRMKELAVSVLADVGVETGDDLSDDLLFQAMRSADPTLSDTDLIARGVATAVALRVRNGWL